MTTRAVLLGLFAGTAISAMTYLNDKVMHQTFLVGNHLPMGLFGALVLFLMVFNPLLSRARDSLAFNGREMGIAVCIALCACSIPGSGLMRYFTYTMGMPIHHNSLRPDWRAEEILQYVPQELLVAGGEDDRDAIDGFVVGLGTRDKTIGLTDIPWHAWWTPLANWLPIIILMLFAFTGLAFVVHRQWSEREHLAYPIAEVASLLIERAPGRPLPSVAYKPLFWFGFGALTAMHLLNAAQVWYPWLPRFPTFLNLWAFRDLMGSLALGVGSDGFFAGWVVPSAIAFAYFAPTDVAFTLGISCLATMAVSVLLTTAGINLVTDSYGGGTIPGAQFGAYLAAFAMIIYTGRSHYWTTLKAAMGLPAKGAEQEATWGMRVWLVSNLLLIMVLVRLGIDWTIALPYVLLASMLLLVLSRIVAETGLFFIQCTWNPFSVLVNILGPQAMGVKLVATLSLITGPMMKDLREAFLPFLINGLQIGRRQGAPMTKLGMVLPGAIVLFLVVALVATLWIQYEFGSNSLADGWGRDYMPVVPFDGALSTLNLLESDAVAPGALERSMNMGPIERLLNLEPMPGVLTAMFFGLFTMLALSFLRLRFSWWPLHPVFLLVAFTYPIFMLWAGFFIGWMFKVAVVNYGGGRVYHQLKPLMVGVVAGELGILFLYFIFALMYYLGALDPLFVLMGGQPVAGIAPRSYIVFPR